MPTSRLLILIALLLSVLGFSPDAKADACQYQARDYQGNNRVLVDYSGNAIERYDYYPYGGLFGEVNPEQWRLYGGKELQTMNGLNLYDFHARWQDHATCWFTTQDPLAEKYYALSPYTYCAGNPIMLIDPTGMEIWINEFFYDIGMSYDGDNEFVKQTITALNTIAENGGKDVIADMVNSGVKYNYKTFESHKTSSHVSKIDDENVEVRINSSTLKDHNTFFSAIAHESMHCAQFENEQGGASIFNEVEANAFSAIIGCNTQIKKSANAFQKTVSISEDPIANRYEGAFNGLVWDGYNPTDMLTAVKLFKAGAAENNSGIYNSYRLYNNSPFESLLKKYQIKIVDL